MNRRLLAAALMLAVPAVCGATAPAAPAASENGTLTADIDAILEAAEADGFGGAIILRQGDRTLLSKGYGLANRETGTPFTTRTVAQIGSITKTFTAVALSNLIAQGLVDPEATFGSYVTDAPEPIASATVNALLTHHSGLRDYCGDDFDRLTEQDFLQRCLAAPLAHEPGANNYANAGYSAIALLIERVTGERWEAYLREQIFGPLGLDHTGFGFAGLDRSDFAKGYLEGVPQDVISQRLAALGGDDWNLRGNGGMQASPEDMMLFIDALARPPCGLRQEICAIMGEPHSPRVDNVAEGYGRFFRYRDDGTLMRTGHSGSDGTFFSYLVWYPRQDIRLYFVGNNGESEVRPLLSDIVHLLDRMPPAE